MEVHLKKILKKGDTVGFISCSDGLKLEDKTEIDKLISVFDGFDVKVKLAETLYRKDHAFSGTARQRADELNKLYADDSIKAIFDLSGGDSANQILDYMDWDCIANNPKMYFGMSDLSVVLNAIYKNTGQTTCHFFIRNIVNSQDDELITAFYETLFRGTNDLFDIEYKYIKGNNLSGMVIGGNIRCFLKLMGTPYLPDPEGKVLLLESLGGNEARIASLFTQLKQSGYLQKLNGIILGNFRQMQCENNRPTVEDLLLDITKDLGISIIKTDELGHRSSAKGMLIGVEQQF